MRRVVGGTKQPGGWSDPGRRAPKKSGLRRALEHAEYDGADKGEGDIRGHNAQSGDERTKGHWKPPKVTSLPAVTP